MPWSSDFRAALNPTGGWSRLHGIFETVLPATGAGVGAEWFAASDGRLGADAYLFMKDDPDGGIAKQPSLGPSAVKPQSAAYQESMWTVYVQVGGGGSFKKGDTTGLYNADNSAAWDDFRVAVRRGSLCRLLLGFPGEARGDYEPLRLGIINNVHMVTPWLAKVTVWDIVTALRFRMVVTAGDKVNLSNRPQSLFYDSFGETEIDTTAYSVTDSTLYVTDASVFKMEDGGVGVAKVTPNAGDPFFLTFTGIDEASTPNELTGCSSAGQFNTTAGAANVGNTVTAQPYLNGHPVNLLLKMLVATGAGSNGAQDKYPADWGFAIPVDWIDQVDFGIWRSTVITATGTYEWNILPTEAVDDPYAWLQQYLMVAGMWLACREGQFVVRAQQPINDATVLERAVTDADVAQGTLPGVEWFSEDAPVTYGVLTVSGDEVQAIPATPGREAAVVTTFPARSRVDLSLSDVLAGVDDTDETAILQEVVDRRHPWYVYCPEVVHITLAGIYSYAPGDAILFSSTIARGRLEGTVGGYDERPVMVVQESVNLAQGTTKLLLAALPEDSAEDS